MSRRRATGRTWAREPSAQTKTGTVCAFCLSGALRSMLDTRVCHVWKGWLYCIEFRKPRGEETQ